MTEVVQRFTSPTVRDIAITLLCILLIGLFRSRDSFTIRPMWRHDLDTEVYSNGKHPQQNEQLPIPKIGDIDGDGAAEIVLITNDHYLLIGAAPTVNASKKVLPHLSVKHQVKLPDESADADKKSQPVVLETGFLTPYESEVRTRKQVWLLIFGCSFILLLLLMA